MQTMADGAGVAKAQKSLLINEDLVRLLEAHQKRTGASFTKQVTAAVLQYLFARPEGPDPYWMEHAVALDGGLATLADIIEDRKQSAELEDEQLDEWSNDAEKSVADDAKAVPRKVAASYMAIAQHARMLVANSLREWEGMLAREEEDAVEKIAAHWANRPARTVPPPTKKR